MIKYRAYLGYNEILYIDPWVINYGLSDGLHYILTYCQGHCQISRSRDPCIGLDTCGSIDTIVSLRRVIPCPSTRPPSCLHPVSTAPELVGDADHALPSAITMVITRDRHCPDIANISTQCANIEISCTTSVPRPIKFHGTCLTAALLNSQSARNKVNLIGEAVIEHDIDILALTETWLTNTPKDEYYTKELSFSGYKLINVP